MWSCINVSSILNSDVLNETLNPSSQWLQPQNFSVFPSRVFKPHHTYSLSYQFKKKKKKGKTKPIVVAHMFNPCIPEAEAGESL